MSLQRIAITRKPFLRFLSTSTSSKIEVTTSFVDGKQLPTSIDSGSSRFHFDNVNPATNNVISEVISANEDDLQYAIESSKEGQRKWSAMSGMERMRIMQRAAGLLRENVAELAKMECEDVGKPLSEALDCDIASGADCIEFFAGVAPTITGRFYSNLQDGSKPSHSFAYTIREPLGVCAGIGAWNYPLQIACWKSAPALASGNSMLFKPSEMTPRSAVRLAQIYMEAGMPAGVFNVLQGASVIGNAIASHPDINKVSFTGEVGTGKKVLNASIPSLKNVTLELGGKSPLIIFPDANLSQAVKAASIANFYTQGEICTNGTRVFVYESIYDEFLKRIVDMEPGMICGDPMDSSTTIGALISEDHMEKVLDYISKGNAEGARLVMGGKRVRPDNAPNGFFVAPTVFADCTDDMTIVREEIFGPVMSVLKFTDEDEVLRRANGTNLGLAAGVFTKDLTRAHRCVSQLQAGMTWINHYNVAPIEIPFGGYKQSGIGRENSAECIQYYTQSKTVYVEMDDRVETPFSQ